MNPLLRMLLGTTWAKGVGERFGGSQTSDFKNLTDAFAKAKGIDTQPSALDAFHMGAKTVDIDWPYGPKGALWAPPAAEEKKEPSQSPMDRIKAAFDSLKDLHKPKFPMAEDPMTAGYPAAPSAPQSPQPVPMPSPRPAEAPQSAPEQGPMMSLFQRSAAMQQDPLTGDYIDPAAAAKAQPNIFQGLFG